MMLMNHLMRNASPEKKRVMFALFGTVLAVGIAMLAAYVI